MSNGTAHLGKATRRKGLHLDDLRKLLLQQIRLGRIAGHQRRGNVGKRPRQRRGARASVTEKHHAVTGRAARNAVGLPENHPVHPGLLHRQRSPGDAAEPRKQPLEHIVGRRREDELVNKLAVLDQAGDRREHLQVIAGFLVRQQQDDELDVLILLETVVTDAHRAAPDGDEVPPFHPQAHVRQRDAKEDAKQERETDNRREHPAIGRQHLA